MWRDETNEYGKYDMKIIIQCSKLIIQLYYIVQCSLDGDTNLSMVSGTMFLLCWAAIFKKDGFKANMHVIGMEEGEGKYVW